MSIPRKKYVVTIIYALTLTNVTKLLLKAAAIVTNMQRLYFFFGGPARNLCDNRRRIAALL